jgi:hypothetical protein
MKIVDGLLWKVAESAADEEARVNKLKFKKFRKPTTASHPSASSSNKKHDENGPSAGASAIAV